MESLDYRYHRICVNNHTAEPEADGSVRIVVSQRPLEALPQAREPGWDYPNWLGTAGHSNGAMLLRYVGATDHPPVQTSVVRLDDLLGTAVEQL
jgi:hypothetical protein